MITVDGSLSRIDDTVDKDKEYQLCAVIKNDPEAPWTGICFEGRKGLEEGWVITCPCGVKVTYPVNEFPTEDAKIPCDNPDHWAVRFEPEKEAREVEHDQRD